MARVFASTQSVCRRIVQLQRHCQSSGNVSGLSCFVVHILTYLSDTFLSCPRNNANYSGRAKPLDDENEGTMHANNKENEIIFE